MLKLRIVSPEEVIYDGDANSLKVPGTLGSFEILDHHAPIISSLFELKIWSKYTKLLSLNLFKI